MGLLEKAKVTKKPEKEKTEEKEIDEKKGLLHKAKQIENKEIKHEIKKKEEKKGLLHKAKEIDKKTEEKEIVKIDEIKEEKTEDQKKGLLEKAKQIEKKQIQQETSEEEKKEEKKGLFSKILNKEKKPKKEKTDEIIEVEKPKISDLSDEKIELIEEKKGYGYKGLASRRIVFNHKINEHLYEVIEPILNEDEIIVKNELSHLFKMLADINITNVNKEEKKKYLKQTLDQIIIDNNISFKPKNKEEKNKEKGLSITKNKKHENTKNEDKKSLINISKELTEEEKKSKEKIFYHIFREFIGYNRIDLLMEDDEIEDISCDGSHVPIFIYHKKYDEVTTNIKFKNDKELNSFVVRLAQICGKQISIFSPIVDGKLPDGSRLQTTLAKTVTNGSTFTIRRFKDNPLTPIDLIGFKSFSLDMAAYFWMAIERGASILFCGGTASGKTTALNALSLFIPSQHKIISIEDTREVNLPHKNWIAGTTRAGFSSSDDKTGKDIDMFDLIRAALRQRPKVVMVGEVRGKEAYSLFQAMSTGHTAYSTVHASTIHTLIQRLENPPIALPRALLTSLDIIVFQNAINMSGKSVRRMTSVTEVIKLDPDTNQLIFMEPFKWVSKTDDRFESSGTSKILNNIRLENNWSEEKLQKELENRKKILKWMIKNNIHDYKDVGRIVSEYRKYPEKTLEMTKEEIKK